MHLPCYFGILRYATLVVFAGGWIQASASAIYRPASDAEIVERIPQALLDLRARAPSRTIDTPAISDPEHAIAAAMDAITLGRRDANPRLFGYAQAALAPWWSMPLPPLEIQLLRAFIHQAGHRFEAALRDLDGVLARDPRNAQAWLSRAAILSVQGDYPTAIRACVHLAGRHRLIAATCTARALLLTRHAPRVFAELQRTLNETASNQPEVQAWAQTTLAELADLQGEPRIAARAFRAALALTPTDTRRLAKYADHLLANAENREVIRLLSGHRDALPLRLRLAIAKRRHDKRLPRADIRALKEAFQTEQRRGDPLHLREAAVANLYLFDRPDSALTLALANWRVQRETADARIVLAAARAARRPEAARPVHTWLKKRGASLPESGAPRPPARHPDDTHALR